MRKVSYEVIDGTIASPLGFSADGLHAGFKKKKLDFAGLYQKYRLVWQEFIRLIRLSSLRF